MSVLTYFFLIEISPYFVHSELVSHRRSREKTHLNDSDTHLIHFCAFQPKIHPHMCANKTPVSKWNDVLAQVLIFRKRRKSGV